MQTVRSTGMLTRSPRMVVQAGLVSIQPCSWLSAKTQPAQCYLSAHPATCSGHFVEAGFLSVNSVKVGLSIPERGRIITSWSQANRLPAHGWLFSRARRTWLLYLYVFLNSATGAADLTHLKNIHIAPAFTDVLYHRSAC